jgi:general secretion pathway protein K
VKRRIPGRERGAALLAVLLLVAVTGAIAASMVEGLRLSRTIAVNATARDQGRLFADGIEQLALLSIDDQVLRSPDRTTLAGNWNGTTRNVQLPGGALADITVRDGSNCFNLNSVVDGQPGRPLVRRASGVAQFMGLMIALDVSGQDARRIAEAAADWVDSDVVTGPAGAEDEAYAAGPAPYRTGNTLFADPGEVRALAGMTPDIYARIRPWICALPVNDLSPININTLGVDQAPLLAMLAPGQLGLDRARSVLGQRPSGGWNNQVEFGRIDAMRDLAVPLDAQLQPQLKTNWFTLDVRIRLMGNEYRENVLVDARLQPSRIVQRRWTE